MGYGEAVAEVKVKVRLRERVTWPSWTVHAWMSIAVAGLFLGITFWWLEVNRAIPVFDAGVRLSQAIILYEYLHEGRVLVALNSTAPYPPFAYLVGALGLWIGGVGVSAPVIAENLVFVPLLALGSYRVARMAFGPRAGFLAVLFALGTPLVTAQFHVFMVDVPETAMVAVSVYLILASERFSRTWLSALAGIAVGLGMLTKEPFVFFVSGVVLVAMLRGGWRNWRGLILFFALAAAIALPWYYENLTEVHTIAQGSLNGGASSPSGIAPAVLSIENLLWYFWNIVNAQLYAPLFALSIVGAIWTVHGFIRRRPVSPLAWELTIGALVAWIGVTVTFVHDTRYGMPLLLYLAVFGTGWIASLRAPLARGLAVGAPVLFVVANTLGDSFGVGGDVLANLPGAKPAYLEGPGLVRVYSNIGFLVSAPHRDGDVLGLMEALRRHGVREVTWIDLGRGEPPPGLNSTFSQAGLVAFTYITKLKQPPEQEPVSAYTSSVAILAHGPLAQGPGAPCVRLNDGSGVWVRLGNPNASHVKNYCPFDHPAFYE
jgi:hypothetical protein